MNSTWLFCYAFFGIFLGHLGDKYRKNRVIFCQFIGVALVQTALGFVVLATNPQQKWTAVYFLLKICDGTLQSFGWAANFGVICNWLPRQGRGFFIGLWASCPSVGDIIGEQLYKWITRNDNFNAQGYTFITLAGMILVAALINLLCLVEFPTSKGITIKEEGQLLDPANVK